MTLDIELSQFENVFVYVSDALRYDYAPDTLSKYGTVTKTIPSGLSTPTSFSSLITGRYPPAHGVYRFGHYLDENLPTIFDLFPNGTFVTDTEHTAPIRETLSLDHLSQPSVSDIETPFVYLLRDLSPHSPLPANDEGLIHDSSADYWADRKRDTATIREDYERGVRHSVKRFETYMNKLDNRGILDETLVIFTADHGELLGDFGFVAHGPPTSPHQLYVPTVFCNNGVDFDGPLLALVDLFPTIAAIAGKEASDELPGYNLIQRAPSDRMVLNQAWLPYIHETSVWDGNGGYVFTESSPLKRLRWFKRLVTGSATAPYHRRGPIQTLRGISMNDRQYGSPKFTENRAREFYNEIASGPTETGEQEISESARKRLEQLGYRDEI